MYCGYCGEKIENEKQKFCPNCGAKLINENENNVEVELIMSEPNEQEEKKSSQPWRVFAIVGYVLGIISIATCLFFGALVSGIEGIVFSALGKKSEADYKKAKKGLLLNILGLSISLLIYIIIIIIAIIIEINA